MQVRMGSHFRVAVSAGSDPTGHAGARGGAVWAPPPQAQPFHVLHDPAASQALWDPLRSG